MKILFFNAVYIRLWKILLKNYSNASWGLGARPTKCCFWQRPSLTALWIGNKILTTQLYLAHEVDFMFTREVCNLWIKSYLLLLKIKLSSKNPTWRREDAKAKIKDCGTPVSPVLVWWYCCFLVVFSSPCSYEMFLSTVFQLPRVRCWRGTRAEKGQSLRWK